MNIVYVKCECKASMKKERRRATAKFNRRNGKVESGSCICPAGIVLTATT